MTKEKVGEIISSISEEASHSNLEGLEERMREVYRNLVGILAEAQSTEDDLSHCDGHNNNRMGSDRLWWPKVN